MSTNEKTVSNRGSMALVDLNDISTIYEGEKFPAIFDISLQIEEGEFVCIIGPNGAGKTTLLETINGLLPYTSGHGRVFGREIGTSCKDIQKRMGYVIQNFEIDPLTPFLCRDVVMMGRCGKLGLLSFARKKDWEIVDEALERVGMTMFSSRPVGKLSGGEFQKILLARAIAQEPELFLLDEPFANLDFSSRQAMASLIQSLHERNEKTMIMISHDLSMIPRGASRILVMEKGKIILDGEREEVLSSCWVQQHLLKGVCLHHHPTT